MPRGGGIILKEAETFTSQLSEKFLTSLICGVCENEYEYKYDSFSILALLCITAAISSSLLDRITNTNVS